MNFMYLIMFAFGLSTATDVQSESLFDFDYKVKTCGSNLNSMIYRICRYYSYSFDNINGHKKIVEKEKLLNMCCAYTCFVKDIVQYCQSESRKRMMMIITDKHSKTELQLDTTTSVIPSTSFATVTLGEKSTNALKATGEMNMASTVEPTQLGQQKVDTDLSKPLNIKPKNISDTFLNIKFNVLHEKYNNQFDHLN